MAEGRELELTYCPNGDCLLPAEVLDDWVQDSTNGPVRCRKTRCVNGHVYTGVTS